MFEKNFNASSKNNEMKKLPKSEKNLTLNDIEKTTLLSFNVLSSHLSKNPFEFQTFYSNLNEPMNKMMKI